MAPAPPLTIDVLAMHGWAGDARCWAPWIKATRDRGWRWTTGERGYGACAPREPRWSEEATVSACRLVIGHSLGPHFLSAGTLRRADAVILLASFAAFVPPGREGRRTRAALAGMSAGLVDERSARAMLGKFMEKVAAPQSVELLPPGPAEGPLDEANRARLRSDLDLLGRCAALPEGFPGGARVLIVEADEDRIVEAEARRMLREALPHAEAITLPGVGHALLADDVINRVVAWAEAWRRPEK